MASAFTDATWEKDVLGSAKPVLVDFWAEWCAPCRIMSQVIDRLASEFDGRASVGKVNVDENALISDRYDIRGIPTIIVFKDGVVKEQVVGVTSEETLSALLEKHLT